jgi:hypothetical protein
MTFGYLSGKIFGNIMGILGKALIFQAEMRVKKFKKSLDFLENLVILCYI